MIKIILCGCSGKMGRVISQIVSNYPSLSIVAGVDAIDSNQAYPIFHSISECNENADVIIDFSRPSTLEELLSYARTKKLSLVLCTTGYTPDQLDKIDEASKEIPLFRSGNMSLGVNVVNNVLKNISAMLYENFDIEIIEKHHNQKVDAPSGTALLLANTIKNAIPEETIFVHGRDGIAKRHHKEIGIHAVRGGSIVGEHEIIFAGQGETITISHSALSREVFAVGALKACEFIHNKKAGLYNMDDVVNQK